MGETASAQAHAYAIFNKVGLVKKVLDPKDLDKWEVLWLAK